MPIVNLKTSVTHCDELRHYVTLDRRQFSAGFFKLDKEMPPIREETKAVRRASERIKLVQARAVFLSVGNTPTLDASLSTYTCPLGCWSSYTICSRETALAAIVLQYILGQSRFHTFYEAP